MSKFVQTIKYSPFLSSPLLSLSLCVSGDGVRSFTHPLYTKNSILDLDFETNARRNGVFVYRVDQDHIIEPTEGMYIC